jgi:predicted esterase
MSKYLGKLSPIFSRASEWSKTTRKSKLDSLKEIDWKKGISDTFSEGAILAAEITFIAGENLLNAVRFHTFKRHQALANDS